MFIEIEKSINTHIDIDKVHNNYIKGLFPIFNNQNSEIGEWNQDSRIVYITDDIDRHDVLKHLYYTLFSEQIDAIFYKSLQYKPIYDRESLILKSNTIVYKGFISKIFKNFEIINHISINKNKCTYNVKIYYKLNVNSVIKLIIKKHVKELLKDSINEFFQNISNY